MKDLKKIEILAPAGNPDSFFAAINNGADAVYLGISGYNARNNIENFQLDNIKEYIDYAHLFGVKVYFTFNTLIKNNEMEDVLKQVEYVYLLGADAFIIQDIGLAINIKKCFPDAILHASTQMGIHNLEGAKVIEQLGFTRVVLARETPIEDIIQIKENTNLEIEYFVQGALCVAFSGNCYLCSLLTGNSGNRGKCQQFCRLKYQLNSSLGNKEGYLLSAKDFCMIPKLKDLINAGVISLKIEGRARRPAYVAQCVSIYKKIIENDFRYDDLDIENLKKSFNRGDYTPGYFDDSKIIYPSIQGHKGIKIGKVKGIIFGKKFNIIKIISNKKISVGDGLKFIKNDKEISSIGVGDVKEINGIFEITTTSKVEEGSDVYLTLDSKEEKEILSIKKKLGIHAIFEARIGERAILKLKYKNKIAQVYSKEKIEEAKNQNLTYEVVKEQLSKLSNEPFYLENLDVKMDKVFLNKSQINDLRRESIKIIKEKIIEDYTKNRRVNCFKKIEGEYKDKNKKIIIVNDLNKIEKNDELIIFDLHAYNDKLIKELNNFCKNNKKIIYINLPIYLTNAEFQIIKKLIENSNIGIVANNISQINICDKKKIIAGMGLNIFNNYSLDFFESLGITKIILSKELLPHEYNLFKSVNDLFAFAYGQEEYMLFKHCPYKEFFNSKCNRCVFTNNLKYKLNNKTFILERKKILNCQFILKSENIVDKRKEIKINQLIEKK